MRAVRERARTAMAIGQYGRELSDTVTLDFGRKIDTP